MKILLDTRETHLYKLLQQLNLDSLVERKQLTLGDLQFIKDNRIVFLVERKTIKDLAASYKDGRLINQIQRIQATGIPPSNVLYLIEGTWRSVRRVGLSKDDLQNLMCDIMLGYQFHVYHVSNKSETIAFLKQIYLSIIELPQIEGITINRIRKHQVSSRSDILASQLYSIPGVSQKVALTISKHFSSMRDLIRTLDNDPNKLKEIIIPYKKPKPISENIINLLVNLM